MGKNVKKFNEYKEYKEINDEESVNEYHFWTKSEGEVNISVYGDDEEGKMMMIEEIQKALNDHERQFNYNLLLDGDILRSGEKR